MKTECVFCRIIAGQLETKILYQDQMVTAFYDMRPITPVHLLVVPNRHLDSLNDMQAEDEIILGHMVKIAQVLANNHGLHKRGYRMVINTGSDAGQSVFHLHLHLIGGRPMPFKM